MPNNRAIILFTGESTDRILQEGGTRSWRIDLNEARRCNYVVCVQNAHTNWGDGHEPHPTAFLAGKVSEIVLTPPRPENNESQNGPRYLIELGEYAHVTIPDCWPKGHQYPVHYSTLEMLGIDPARPEWKILSRMKRQP